MSASPLHRSGGRCARAKPCRFLKTPLFSLNGTTFGGYGVQTFNLPDLRGRVGKPGPGHRALKFTIRGRRGAWNQFRSPLRATTAATAKLASLGARQFITKPVDFDYLKVQLLQLAGGAPIYSPPRYLE